MNDLFVSVEDLQKYTGVYPEEANSQQELFIKSAQDIIINYLGYNPLKADRKEIYSGSGDNWLFLNSRPINSIQELIVNDEIIPLDKVIIKSSSIQLIEGVFPKGNYNIRINYNSGFQELPVIIKNTCLRISAILQTEADNNIGITSKSFGDSGSRTFYNFTNFNKYLVQLSYYQIY